MALVAVSDPVMTDFLGRHVRRGRQVVEFLPSPVGDLVERCSNPRLRQVTRAIQGGRRTWLTALVAWNFPDAGVWQQQIEEIIN